MPRNESGLDRIVRASLGLALLSLAFTGPCVWVGVVGLVVLITGILGSCPLYALLGISTCRTQHLGEHGPGTGSR